MLSEDAIVRSPRASTIDWLVVTVIFFFVYSVSFSFAPIHSARVIVILGGFVFVAASLLRDQAIAIDGLVLAVFGLFLVYLTWAGWRTAVYGFEDTAVLISAALLIFQGFVGSGLVILMLRRRLYDVEQFVRAIHVVILIQGMFIVLSFLSPAFRELTVALIPPAPSNVDPLDPFRVRGLTHITGAKLSGVQAVGILTSAYLVVRSRSWSQLIYLTVSFMIAVASILLTGRTGLLMIPLAVVFLLAYRALAGRFSRKALLLLMLSPFAITGILLLLQHAYVTGLSTEVEGIARAFSLVVHRVWTEFAGYFQQRTLETGTVGVLLEEHWHFPKDQWQFLVGDPTTWTNQIQSDIGVVRMIFAVGLVGATLLYGATFCLFLVTARRLSTRRDRMLVWFLFVWIAVLEFKEPLFTFLPLASLYGLLFFFVSVVLPRRAEQSPQAIR